MDAVKRFLQYVGFDTQSQEESSTFPSTLKQKKLGQHLLDELRSLGIKDVRMDDFGYVYAKVPSNCGSTKTLGLISHMDTSPDASGKDIHPRTILYQGGDVVVCDDLRLTAEELKDKIGHELIITDGTTLLGADDKAGIAIIMSAVETLLKEDRPYPNLILCFTPDEEVGAGTDHFDFAWYRANALDAYTYTIDGGDIREINYETFNAASAKVMIHGRSIHPGSAKDRLLNAQIVAMDYFAHLPSLERPEHTENYQGFYHLTGMQGDVSHALLSFIIRDHDRKRFEERKKYMHAIAYELNLRYGKGTIEVEIEDSYYNMREPILEKKALLYFAKKALSENGVEPIEKPIRGGTDGAHLSFEGIPCPNLGTGGENFHGPLEYLDVHDFKIMIQVVIDLANALIEGVSCEE